MKQYGVWEIRESEISLHLGVEDVGLGTWVLKRGNKRTSTRTGKRGKDCYVMSFFGVNSESSWLFLICVEFLGALWKVLCSGWDVSAHHWVLYKKLGPACEAGLKAGAACAVATLPVLLPGLFSCRFSSTWLSGGLPELHPKEWPAKDSAEW